ncbi:NADH dehydrogenase subunit C [Desulfonispora thiosulfatigenes DSM 11270]|uniref:NAD(P)H dehydrogenase subunit J n=1 Tax=Desulfonispora thiosulfatigenes DSM 11270 TaxID=656914 RepID=A0A1W1VKS4_DESTI|nr:NADH-quinone oxidoreductase subunit C [Desulfonispora thiosulfatigenes]SMB93896.1 NADH dehydrogenase subunit C [Desulfonispora thiosulfatigenes DSM 11270]
MNNIKELLESYSEKINFHEEKLNEIYLNESSDITEIMNYLKDNGYTFLVDVTSVDYKEYFEMIYQLFSFTENIHLTVKTKLSHEDPQIDSMTSLWDTADWHEREAYDLMGIKFNNHPNLVRILTWDDFEGHPLRKDYEYESNRK